MFFVDKKMRIENFPKLKRCDHSPKRDKFIDVSLDPPYFSLDSPFNITKLIHYSVRRLCFKKFLNFLMFN